MATGKERAANRDALSVLSGTHSLRTLSPDECFDLLEPGGVGRVAFMSADGVMVLPVNFAVLGRAIIFRTAPDTLLAVYANARVGFEADSVDEALQAGWSVLVQGHAHTINDEREVRHLEDATRLQPWAGGARDVYVRIAPARISGRRIGPG
ncbi:pyridoxamine 5'-phosphate oxidase family protein [Trebonia sp.]|uniref:pyridoxamine 5'-phosphate oxidase family protein n=1 Tax=Trebonia sp. TaxID=2767075 RepID=UPI0026378AC9|nr:pyridoxamine 5'-phosphate oxidase family protein [Trebonia sp.]